mmetsp:Transcript_8539/g.26813  ORF Transcript_8539/g.26813 Transcript_8539/m.26813 type:complete len:251 (+) Transcript_8539:1663-2415(+)
MQGCGLSRVGVPWWSVGHACSVTLDTLLLSTTCTAARTATCAQQLAGHARHEPKHAHPRTKGRPWRRRCRLVIWRLKLCISWLKVLTILRGGVDLEQQCLRVLLLTGVKRHIGDHGEIVQERRHRAVECAESLVGCFVQQRKHIVTTRHEKCIEHLAVDEVTLAQYVDMRNLKIDHGRHGEQGAAQEARRVAEEHGVQQENTTAPHVVQLQMVHQLSHHREMGVQLDLARQVHQEVLVVIKSIHLVLKPV